MNWDQKTVDNPKRLHYSAALDAGSRGYHYFKDPQLRGHALRVYATGRRSFVVRSTVNGRMREHALGNAMKDGGMSLKAAREEAQTWLAQLRKGVDPAEAKVVVEKKTALEATTLSAALKWYLDNQNVAAGTKRVLRNGIEFHLKAWLDKPLLSIDRPMVRTRYAEILRDTKAGGVKRNGEIANKVMRNLSAVYNVWTFDHARALRDQGIAAGGDLNPAKAGRNERVKPKKVLKREIKKDQLPLLLAALPKVSKTTSTLFRLMLRTGLRVGACMSLKQSYVDEGVITIPGDVDRGKVGTGYRDREEWMVVPVTPGIQKLLDEAARLRAEQVRDRWVSAERAALWIFPSRRSRSGHLESQQHFYRELAAASGVDLTAHTVRSVFTTWVQKVPGMTLIELKALLNHTTVRAGADVTEGYSPVDIDRRRELLVALERLLPLKRSR